MSYAGYQAQMRGNVRIIHGEPPEIINRPPQIVLADCVTPETRSRKPFIEFPAGIDSIGQSLVRAGYSIDYTFLPPEEIRREMRHSGMVTAQFRMFRR